MGKEQLSEINQDPYAAYDLVPFLKQVIIQDSVSRQEDYLKRKSTLNDVLKIAWGENANATQFVAPSTASNCLKWVGYSALGYKPAPKKYENEMQAMMGTSAHWSFTKKLSPYGPQEYEFIVENPDISGRMDFLFKNPLANNWEVVDFKFVGSYVYRNIKREGLSPELKINKKNYKPGVEARKQLLLYMWAEDKRGLDISCGQVVYINRDSGEMKGCIIPWGPKEEFEANTFVDQIRAAKEKIANNELPDPSVESKHVCKSFLPIYCLL